MFILAGLLLWQAETAAQRQSKTINDGWKFCKGDVPAASETTFDDSNWQRIHLPHTWNTDAYTHKDYYRGVGWYRRQLTTDSMYAGKQIFIRFEAASKAATLYVNGERVGEHLGGYTAFTFDITPYCHPDGNNTIAVRVDNNRDDIPPISGDFTFFGGIYRDVWLVTTGSQHFNMLNLASPGVFIHSTTESNDRATLSIRSEVKNDAPRPAKLSLRQTIYTPEGEIVKQLRQTITVAPNTLYTVNQAVDDIPSPQLWTPETPNLYRVESLLTDAKTGAVIDRIEQHTGFRWYSFDPQHGFTLNGVPYKLRGVCRHQDQNPLGPALPDEMHRRDMQLMKEMGANFIRISHYPQDDAILEQCDRLGLLVWEEIPVIDIVPDSETYANVAETNLREMIRQHYNHPSVIAWGYMNEILLVTQRRYTTPETLGPVVERTLALAQRLEKALKEEDPHRTSIMAYHGSNTYNETGLGSIADVSGWNLYQGWYGGTFDGFDAFLDHQQRRYPERPVLVSEFGAGSDHRIHSLSPQSFDFSIEYQQLYLEHYLPAIEQRPFVAGSTYWNFIDFSSALRDESMPRINNKGLVYADRRPKDVFYYVKAMYRKDIPVLHIASRDWAQRIVATEGEQPALQPLKLYTNLPEAELFVNGQSFGKKESHNCTIIYMVPLRDGTNTLRAIGHRDGIETEDAMTLTFAVVPHRLYTQPNEQTELAVNAGSNSTYTGNESGLAWLPDRPYTPGSWGYLSDPDNGKPTFRTQTEIAATTDGPLYQTLLDNPVGYKFDVPGGEYEVELLFADVFADHRKPVYLLTETASGQTPANVFHIDINGQRVEEAFQPAQTAGPFVAIRKRFIVAATDKGIEVRFEKVNGRTFLNAIKLRKLF